MRGQGRVYRPKARGRATAVWWLDYGLRGARHRESSGKTSKKGAMRLLRERITAREAGKIVGRPDRVMLAEYVKAEDGTSKLVGGLRALVERQYAVDGCRSLDRLQDAFAGLERLPGADARAPDLTATRLDTYAEAHLAAGASRATVNYELAAVHRGFRLAVKKGCLSVMPLIELPTLRNARSGFFEDGVFAALVLELPADIRSCVS